MRLVKIAVNIMFNAETRRARSWPSRRLYMTTRRCVQPAVSPDNERWWAYQTFTKKLVEAIERKHRRIKKHFNSDCGARFQRQDSDMAMEVMTRMIHRTGRCPLPVHDSFLVADIDTEELRQTMKEVARHHSLRLKIKESKAVTTTIKDLIDTHSPLVHLNTTAQDANQPHHQFQTPQSLQESRNPNSKSPTPTTTPSVPLPVFN